MRPEQIAADVDRGLVLVAQIETLQSELKTISKRLEQAALEGDQIPLTDDARDGMQFRAAGSESTVPVIITADAIIQSFVDGSPAHARAENTSVGKLDQFFKKTATWKNQSRDGKAFRQEAAALLGDDAPAFVRACIAVDKDGIPKNSIKIEWTRADANQPAA